MLALIMSLGGWFLPRTLEDGFYSEKKCFVSILYARRSELHKHWNDNSR